MVVKQSVCVSVRFLRTFLWFLAQAERTAPWWQLLELQAHPFEALAKTNHLRKGLSFLCCVFFFVVVVVCFIFLKQIPIPDYLKQSLLDRDLETCM